MIVTTPAIIVKSRKFKESSKLLTAYTRDFGKLSFVANGARRMSKKGGSRFGSALDPLSLCTLSFQKKEGRDLHTLISAEAIHSSLDLQQSYDVLTTGFALAESILSTQLEEQVHPDIFDRVVEALNALHSLVAAHGEHVRPSQAETVLIHFYIRLAESMGFALHPFRCPITQEDVHPRQAEHFTMSLSDGAPFQPRIAGYHQGYRLDTYALEALQELFSMESTKVCTRNYEAFVIGQLHEFLGRYFVYHCERQLTPRTDAFIREA